MSIAIRRHARARVSHDTPVSACASQLFSNCCRLLPLPRPYLLLKPLFAASCALPSIADAALDVAGLKQRDLHKDDVKEAQGFYAESLDLAAYSKVVNAFVGLARAKRAAFVAAVFAKVEEAIAKEKKAEETKPADDKAAAAAAPAAPAAEKKEEAKPAEEKAETRVTVGRFKASIEGAVRAKGQDELRALDAPKGSSCESYSSYAKGALTEEDSKEMTAAEFEKALGLPSLTAEALVEASKNSGGLIGGIGIGGVDPNDLANAALGKTGDAAKLAAEKSAEAARAAYDKSQEAARMAAEKSAEAARLAYEKSTEAARLAAEKSAEAAKLAYEKSAAGLKFMGDGASKAGDAAVEGVKAVGDGAKKVAGKIGDGIEKVPGGGLVTGLFSALGSSMVNIVTCGGKISINTGSSDDKKDEAPEKAQSPKAGEESPKNKDAETSTKEEAATPAEPASTAVATN